MDLPGKGNRRDLEGRLGAGGDGTMRELAGGWMEGESTEIDDWKGGQASKGP